MAIFSFASVLLLASAAMAGKLPFGQMAGGDSEVSPEEEAAFEEQYKQVQMDKQDDNEGIHDLYTPHPLREFTLKRRPTTDAELDAYERTFDTVETFKDRLIWFYQNVMIKGPQHLDHIQETVGISEDGVPKHKFGVVRTRRYKSNEPDKPPIKKMKVEPEDPLNYVVPCVLVAGFALFLVIFVAGTVVVANKLEADQESEDSKIHVKRSKRQMIIGIIKIVTYSLVQQALAVVHLGAKNKPKPKAAAPGAAPEAAAPKAEAREAAPEACVA